ncbi:MAG TPA: 3-hydroxyacyl-CoA dehydrogenase NAD-binding domain-containing protein, partial [Gemmatimonadaceae bacterium]
MAASLDKNTRVGVLGAGAMGTGIAQVAAMAGHHVIVVDANSAAVERSRATVQANLARDVEKRRVASVDAAAAQGRMQFVATSDMAAFKDCGLVIEAIIEDLGVKRSAFSSLDAVVAPDCVLATNTSSLSVSAIAAGCARPERVLGVHFFNPVPLMKLVEV